MKAVQATCTVVKQQPYMGVSMELCQPFELGWA